MDLHTPYITYTCDSYNAYYRIQYTAYTASYNAQRISPLYDGRLYIFHHFFVIFYDSTHLVAYNLVSLDL